METIDVRMFTAEIERYKPLVFQVCNSFVHDYFDAEDLTQETFLAQKDADGFRHHPGGD